MEWVIGTLIGVFTIGIQFYVWIWPRLQSKATDKKEARRIMKEKLAIAIDRARLYKGSALAEPEEIAASHLPKNLRGEVVELERLENKCREWRHEAWQVVNTEVKSLARSDQFKN